MKTAAAKKPRAPAASRTYAVVLTFPAHVQEIFDSLRQDYQQYMDYRIVPHITVVYPFTPSGDIEKVNVKLEKAAQKLKPFKLEMKGVRYFEGKNNVAYVAVRNTGPVKEMHDALNKALVNDARFQYELLAFSEKEFIPHMTIGEHIPEDILPDVKDRFMLMNIRFEVDVKDFMLFSEENGNWKVEKVFGLGKN